MTNQNPYQSPPNSEVDKSESKHSLIHSVRFYLLFLLVLHLNLPIAISIGSGFRFFTMRPDVLNSWIKDHSLNGPSLFLVVYFIGYVMFSLGIIEGFLKRDAIRPRVYVYTAYLLVHLILMTLDFVAAASV